jgi:hypothetical protein
MGKIRLLALKARISLAAFRKDLLGHMGNLEKIVSMLSEVAE